MRADPTTGALTVTDRRTGVSYGPANVFVDGGDAGDSYTFAPPVLDTIVDRPTTPPVVEATHDDLGANLRVAQELVVPAALADGRGARASRTAALRITSVVTLTHGCPRVDVQTTVANAAEDHRLRVLFTAPVDVDHVHADGAFEVVRRPLGAMAMEGTVLEDPVPDAPQHGFVLLHDRRYGLAVANVGLPEYEAFRSGAATTLALTLLRCVGWLSRDDLPTRRGPAGPTLPVPEAQCPGAHTFTYSLIPFAGDWHAIIDEARRAQVPLRALSTTPAAGALPARGTFLSVDAPGVLVSALKGAEDSEGIVLRLYNVGDAAVQGTLRLVHPVRRVERLSLDERSLRTLHHGDPLTAVPLTLGPHQIETLRLVP